MQNGFDALQPESDDDADMWDNDVVIEPAASLIPADSLVPADTAAPALSTVHVSFDEDDMPATLSSPRRAVHPLRGLFPVMHKCHVLLLIASGLLYSDLADDNFLQSVMLSLLPPSLASDQWRDHNSVAELMQLLEWFANAFQRPAAPRLPETKARRKAVKQEMKSEEAVTDSDLGSDDEVPLYIAKKRASRKVAAAAAAAEDPVIAKQSRPRKRGKTVISSSDSDGVEVITTKRARAPLKRAASAAVSTANSTSTAATPPASKRKSKQAASSASQPASAATDDLALSPAPTARRTRSVPNSAGSAVATTPSAKKRGRAQRVPSPVAVTASQEIVVDDNESTDSDFETTPVIKRRVIKRRVAAAEAEPRSADRTATLSKKRGRHSKIKQEDSTNAAPVSVEPATTIANVGTKRGRPPKIKQESDAPATVTTPVSVVAPSSTVTRDLANASLASVALTVRNARSKPVPKDVEEAVRTAAQPRLRNPSPVSVRSHISVNSSDSVMILPKPAAPQVPRRAELVSKLTDTAATMHFERPADAVVAFVALCRALSLQTRLVMGLNALLQKPASMNLPEEENVLIWFCEVFSTAEKRWIHVNPLSTLIDQRVSERYVCDYVLGFRAGALSDISARYSSDWTRTMKLRAPDEWWQTVLECTSSVRDELRAVNEQEMRMTEQQELHQVIQAGVTQLPTSKQDYKKHPLYCLKEHLLKFEAIRPTAEPVGKCGKFDVYRRSDMTELHTRERWPREGRVVRDDEAPFKTVKGRKRLATADAEPVMAQLFGDWQTELLVPPRAENGIVPKSQYGNVELFHERSLPEGCVHINLPRIAAAARKVGCDFATAMTGWDHHKGRPTPVIQGIVICAEFETAVRDMHNVIEQKRIENSIKKRSVAAIARWRTLTKKLLVRSRMQEKYDANSSKS
eukprot:TRINITY_DN2048_c0_g1_i1.p1 TRINITY_DN2048_c0_g1~~TRINITY_DN2048_c0_g1_i1.p1  ORF type:complete len:918 (-),score=232.38 TRINITY_DN2048_c0_g1_i1:1333-4086(-)